MPVTGPDFISLQTRDLDASQKFYERYLGLVRSQSGPPHAVVFDTQPIAFALREIVPGTDLASARDRRQRQGRHSSSTSSAENPTRSALVPCAPTAGNSQCLAHDVPMPSAVTEPRTARKGRKR